MTRFGTISSPNLDAQIKALQTADREAMKAWRKEGRAKVSVPWAAELAQQAPRGTKGAAAGRSIKPGTGNHPIVWAGKGTWRGWQPFFALEFGMSHSKYHTYIRSRGGRRHVVRRRSGTWAMPHLGSHGYWFWPYWEKNEEHLREKVEALFNDFVRSHFGA